ncbi:SRPBCC family protein [Agathobaculum sp. Marseille-P7918]|uniref:SRPBCC family protein n=1 Tax=Agathobaculum sp. Marseille-P7918 TaxID=2479843 RepID=UPI000F64178B|nr:SRPBCC family protein [Agathobaculum sp. Marseille-P7918]
MSTSKVTVHFSCSVERVWQTVTDLTCTAWRSDLERVEVVDETHFIEHTKSGYTTNFTVIALEPPYRWAFTMENNNMSGSWEGIFEATADGARLTCTETVNAKHWWMRPFVPGYLKRQQKLYLDDLRKELDHGNQAGTSTGH